MKRSIKIVAGLTVAKRKMKVKSNEDNYRYMDINLDWCDMGTIKNTNLSG